MKLSNSITVKTLCIGPGRSEQTVQTQIRPRGYKTFSCSTQLGMKFFLHINVKMPTILTFMSGKNSILDLSEPKKLNFLIFLYL